MSKFVNTYERHPSPKMQTHWYQATYMDCRNAIIDIARDMTMNISNIDDNYREILVVNKQYKLMVKVTEFSINETSVDLYLEVLNPFNIFKWRKFIESWHQALGRKMPFLGIALHP